MVLVQKSKAPKEAWQKFCWAPFSCERIHCPTYRSRSLPGEHCEKLQVCIVRCGGSSWLDGWGWWKILRCVENSIRKAHVHSVPCPLGCKDDSPDIVESCTRLLADRSSMDPENMFVNTQYICECMHGFLSMISQQGRVMLHSFRTLRFESLLAKRT